MNLDRFQSVGDDPLVIEWHLQRHIMFTFEIDLEALEPLVAPELTPVEVRPGIGLYSVATLLYQPEQFYPGSPPFMELVSVAHVQSDLSVKMPLSRFAMHAISVYSDSPDFIRQEGEKLFTPTTLDPSLEMTWTESWDGVTARDAEGPIITLRNTHPSPVFAPDELWGQHYNDTHGLHFGVWEWDGIKCEHQHRGDAATFHPHPFYKGMDLARIRGCYRQMIPKPGSTATERFYRVRSLPRRR
ncbi:MAG: hypothetical protein ABI678_19270 [Kofleriaceae bacterium]